MPSETLLVPLCHLTTGERLAANLLSGQLVLPMESREEASSSLFRQMAVRRADTRANGSIGQSHLFTELDTLQEETFLMGQERR